MRDCLHLLLSVAHAARNNCAAEGVTSRFKDEPAWAEVISKGVVHDVTAAKPGSKYRLGGAAGRRESGVEFMRPVWEI